MISTAAANSSAVTAAAREDFVQGGSRMPAGIWLAVEERYAHRFCDSATHC